MSVSSPIPADPALEEDLVIHECRAGYAAQGAKFAVISCGPPAAHGNFEIQESDSQLTRFAGTLIYAGWQWGRHCWLADAWFLAVEYICALGSSVLKDPALRLIAERQVQFVLGANPFAMSYMVGIGRRHSTKKPLFVHEDGRDVLWGIATGIMCGGGADCGGTTAKNTLRGGLSEIGGYDAACEETWMNSTAWFLAVLALLAHDDFETLKVQR